MPRTRACGQEWKILQVKRHRRITHLEWSREYELRHRRHILSRNKAIREHIDRITQRRRRTSAQRPTHHSQLSYRRQESSTRGLKLETPLLCSLLNYLSAEVAIFGQSSAWIDIDSINVHRIARVRREAHYLYL